MDGKKRFFGGAPFRGKQEVSEANRVLVEEDAERQADFNYWERLRELSKNSPTPPSRGKPSLANKLGSEE